MALFINSYAEGKQKKTYMQKDKHRCLCFFTKWTVDLFLNQVDITTQS